MKKQFLLQINVNESDYKLLSKLGFMFEKNINEYLHDIAEQVRTAKKELKKLNEYEKNLRKIHIKA